MNRRAFLGTVVGGVAAGAAIRTFPFRVYSFPTDIKVVSAMEFPAWMYSATNFFHNAKIDAPADPEERRRISDALYAGTRGFYGPALFSDEQLAQAGLA
jgi:hypothetical protein